MTIVSPHFFGFGRRQTGRSARAALSSAHPQRVASSAISGAGRLLRSAPDFPILLGRAPAARVRTRSWSGVRIESRRAPKAEGRAAQ